MALGMAAATLGAAGVGAAMTGVGMGVQNKRNQKAYEQTQKLQQQQYQNQMGLNLQGYNLQKQMWDYTNYGNQMKHMRDAGLNPSLMYGMKGGGGATTGSQGGGSAAGAQAPSQPNVDMNTAMMGMQMKLMQAQADNLDAKTGNEKEGVANKLAAEAKALLEKANVSAKEALKKVSETEYQNIVNEIRGLDEEYLKKYNISETEAPLIKQLKGVGMEMKDIVEMFAKDGFKVIMETLFPNVDRYLETL